MAARNERGSEQLPYEFSSTSLAHLKRKGQVQISELFVEEKCSGAVLDFLRSRGVGRTVAREDGENEEDQTGRASRLGRRIR